MEKQPLAWVVGVGPGLGAALCRALAGRGYAVAGLARTVQFGEQLAAEIGDAGGRFTMYAGDIADPVSVDAVMQRINRELGAASVYIHNASQFLMKPLLETTPAELESVWRITCLGALNGVRHVIPPMLRQRRGTLLFTGATASLRGGANFAAFASAKFALRGMVQSMAREYGPQGIHVAHVILDGLIWGQAAEKFHVPRDKCLEPAAIAATYLQLIDQPRSAWTHEIDLRPDVEKF
ncbi:MAG: SDR family NAD(P)-dependent oxidoreductase [Gammaproteobacteria bacterium]|nr:SDR family NAD(P)-dependent oxidoreductase [Gammaproteobacteria bacterium]